MADLFLMKTLKALLSFFCYFGTGLIAVDELVIQTVEEALFQVAGLNARTKAIIFFLLVAFWCIKILWFIYDKYLETKERELGMDKTKEEIEDLKDGHKKKKGAKPPNPNAL
jgi:hypothetical protein